MDNEGIRQPYALRLADIYFKGRIHTDDRRDSILGDDHYDGVKNWGNDEGGKNIYVRTFGNVIGQNLKKALKYYTIAAENNSSKGMIKLQFLYRVKAIKNKLDYPANKLGLKPPSVDYTLSHKYLFMACNAESESSYAIVLDKYWGPLLVKTPKSSIFCSVGDWYASGTKGFKKDLKEAVNWYSKAIDAGSEVAVNRLQEIIFNIETKKSLSGFFSKLFGKK